MAELHSDLSNQASTSACNLINTEIDTSINTDVSFCAVQNMAVDIGIQCELGCEAFYKYSTLFESDNNQSDESVHSSDFSTNSGGSESDMLEHIDKRSNSTNDQIEEEFQPLPGNFEFVLVQITALLTLFKFCGVCNFPITDIRQYAKRGVLYINYKCSQGHEKK